MRAVVVLRYGGPEVLDVRDVAPPSVRPGHVLVAVEAVGVNYLDTQQRRGATAASPPFVTGLEGAGVIQEVGPDVTSFAPGTRVAWPMTPASAAQTVVLPVGAIVAIPDAVSSETAAALVAQGLTAHYLASDCYPVRPGDAVLVHAAAGGVGSLLTQIARNRGARVFGTVSGPAKAAVAERAGAEVLAYDDFDARIRESTEGHGVAAVFDSVGQATFEQNLAALAPRGGLINYGKTSGPIAPIDPQRLTDAGSVWFTKPKLADFIGDDLALAQRAKDLFAWVLDGSLKVEVSARYSFEEAHAAHDAIDSRRSTGKILLVP